MSSRGFKNNSGNTLIQVMVSMGIAAIVTSATLAAIRMNVFSQRQMKEDMRINDAAKMVRAHLRNQLVCRCHFLGQEIPKPEGLSEPEQWQLPLQGLFKYEDLLNCENPQPVLSLSSDARSPASEIWPGDIYLKNLERIGTSDRYFADLVVTSEPARGIGGSIGKQRSMKMLLLTAENDKGQQVVARCLTGVL